MLNEMALVYGQIAVNPGLSPHGGCPRHLRREPPQLDSPQTAGTAPDGPGDSPALTTTLLKLATFYSKRELFCLN